MTSQSLARLADLAEGADTIQPPPRRAAIAATLRQIAGWARQDETTLDGMLGSLGVALERLAEPHPDDDERVTARRKTCAELSAVALAAASADQMANAPPTTGASGARLRNCAIRQFRVRKAARRASRRGPRRRRRGPPRRR